MDITPQTGATNGSALGQPVFETTPASGGDGVDALPAEGVAEPAALPTHDASETGIAALAPQSLPQTTPEPPTEQPPAAATTTSDDAGATGGAPTRPKRLATESMSAVYNSDIAPKLQRPRLDPSGGSTSSKPGRMLTIASSGRSGSKKGASRHGTDRRLGSRSRSNASAPGGSDAAAAADDFKPATGDVVLRIEFASSLETKNVIWVMTITVLACIGLTVYNKVAPDKGTSPYNTDFKANGQPVLLGNFVTGIITSAVSGTMMTLYFVKGARARWLGLEWDARRLRVFRVRTLELMAMFTISVAWVIGNSYTPSLDCRGWNKRLLATMCVRLTGYNLLLMLWVTTVRGMRCWRPAGVRQSARHCWWCCTWLRCSCCVTALPAWWCCSWRRFSRASSGAAAGAGEAKGGPAGVIALSAAPMSAPPFVVASSEDAGGGKDAASDVEAPGVAVAEAVEGGADDGPSDHEAAPRLPPAAHPGMDGGQVSAPSPRGLTRLRGWLGVFGGGEARRVGGNQPDGSFEFVGAVPPAAAGGRHAQRSSFLSPYLPSGSLEDVPPEDVDLLYIDAPLLYQMSLGLMLFVLYQGVIVVKVVLLFNALARTSFVPGESCLEWFVDCDADKAGLLVFQALSAAAFVFYLLVYGGQCWSAFSYLASRSYIKYRALNIFLRVEVRIRGLVLAFLVAFELIKIFVTARSDLSGRHCSIGLDSLLGMWPAEAVTEVLVVGLAWLFLPRIVDKGIPLLQETLQAFSWTEKELPMRRARRLVGMPLGSRWQQEVLEAPMFCFETALKLTYWCEHAYYWDEPGCEMRVPLPQLMAMYGLEHWEIIREETSDAKAILAWNWQTILVCFRGTASLKAAVVDLKAYLEAYDDRARWSSSFRFARLAAVHHGFQWSWRHNSFSLRVLERVREHRAAHPHAKMIITGHSLGGAHAILCSLELMAQLQPPKNHVVCYTFGAPRTGNHAFSGLYNRVVPETWNVINSNDMVPLTPKFVGWFVYKHPGQKVVVKRCGDLIVRPTYTESTVMRAPCARSVLNHLLGSYLRSYMAVLYGQIFQRHMEGGLRGLLYLAGSGLPEIDQLMETLLGPLSAELGIELPAGIRELPTDTPGARQGSRGERASPSGAAPPAGPAPTPLRLTLAQQASLRIAVEQNTAGVRRLQQLELSSHRLAATAAAAHVPGVSEDKRRQTLLRLFLDRFDMGMEVLGVDLGLGSMTQGEIAAGNRELAALQNVADAHKRAERERRRAELERRRAARASGGGGSDDDSRSSSSSEDERAREGPGGGGSQTERQRQQHQRAHGPAEAIARKWRRRARQRRRAAKGAASGGNLQAASAHTNPSYSTAAGSEPTPAVATAEHSGEQPPAASPTRHGGAAVAAAALHSVPHLALVVEQAVSHTKARWGAEAGREAAMPGPVAEAEEACDAGSDDALLALEEASSVEGAQEGERGGGSMLEVQAEAALAALVVATGWRGAGEAAIAHERERMRGVHARDACLPAWWSG